MAVVGMKQLLEAGVHFGHQTRRWNPKMKPYIYTERNGIHIIDLQKTVAMLDRAYAFVQDVTRDGGRVLFVGTKKQAQDAVAEEATRAGQFYVNQRWLGGLLTNFQTIQQRLRRLDSLERMKETGVFDRLPKKEQLKLGDEIAKLTRMLGGIRGMKRLPEVLFIIDTKKEHIAIHEARRLDIPIVALLDTNSDPDEVDYAIPANDDAIRAVRLLSGKIADAAYEGAQERESTMVSNAIDEGVETEAYEGGYSADPEGYDASIDYVSPERETEDAYEDPLVDEEETPIQSRRPVVVALAHDDADDEQGTDLEPNEGESDRSTSSLGLGDGGLADGGSVLETEDEQPAADNAPESEVVVETTEAEDQTVPAATDSGNGE